MRKTSVKLLAGVAFMSTVLIFNQHVLASSSPSDLLREAYAALAGTDKDYKGHRAAAMRHIEAAAKLDNFDLRSNNKAYVSQGLSDVQMETAQNLLSRARDDLTGKAAQEVNKAILEISAALGVQ